MKESEEEKQLFFPFAGEIRVSPETFDYFAKSLKGVHKRITDLQDTIADMEDKLIARQDKIAKIVKDLERKT